MKYIEISWNTVSWNIMKLDTYLWLLMFASIINKDASHLANCIQKNTRTPELSQVTGPSAAGWRRPRIWSSDPWGPQETNQRWRWRAPRRERSACCFQGPLPGRDPSYLWWPPSQLWDAPPHCPPWSPAVRSQENLGTWGVTICGWSVLKWEEARETKTSFDQFRTSEHAFFSTNSQ